eukprot:PhF_6_TR5723/c0_g1_i1/m.8433/K20359/RABAC1, PRAF1; PRA1 family protein 1
MSKDLDFVQVPLDGGLGGSPSATSGGSAGGTTTDSVSFFSRVGLFVNRIRMVKDERMRNLRPWASFFDKTKFSIPGKIEGVSRVNKNVRYFYSNYLFVVALVAIYVILTNLTFVLTMGFCGSLLWYYRVSTANGEPFIVRGNEIGPTKAYGSLGTLTLFMFWLTGGSSTIFWLVTLSAGVVVGHAATREAPEDSDSILMV